MAEIQLKKLNTKLLEQIKLLRAQLNECNSSLESKSKECTELNALIESLGKNAFPHADNYSCDEVVLEKELHEIKNKHAALQVSYDAASVALDDMKRLYKSAVDDCEILRDEVTNTKNKIEVLTETLARATDKIETLEATVEENKIVSNAKNQAKIDESESVFSLYSIIDCKTNECNELKALIESISKSTPTSIDTTYDTIVKENAALQRNYDSSLEALEDMKRLYSSALKDCEVAREELKLLQLKFEECNNKHRNLSDTVASFHLKNERDTAFLKILDNENRNLKEMLLKKEISSQNECIQMNLNMVRTISESITNNGKSSTEKRNYTSNSSGSHDVMVRPSLTVQSACKNAVTTKTIRSSSAILPRSKKVASADTSSPTAVKSCIRKSLYDDTASSLMHKQKLIASKKK